MMIVARIIYLCCFFVMVLFSHAQNDQSALLNIGDPAPPLRVGEWLKGNPVERFEKGKMYVVEFWATWCKPCRVAIPHLSKLAGKYKKKVVVIGIDVYEQKAMSIERIKAFVDSMGHKMNYIVAKEDSNFMETTWLDPSEEHGIPVTFVVNTEGKIAWIGHPIHLNEILPKIENNNLNLNDSLARRNMNRQLEKLDYSANDSVSEYNGSRSNFYGEPDLAFNAINKIINKEPGLKYSPLMAFNTFSALLKLSPHEAYEYGKKVLVTATYEEPDYNSIIGPIEWYSDKLTFPPEIYELGADALELKVVRIQKGYLELLHPYEIYHEMAEWYWRGNNKSKAIQAEKNAIRALKGKKLRKMH
jgi:thiol-disulfide isomerase/thioredoxin